MRKLFYFVFLINTIAYSQKVRSEIDSIVSQLVNSEMEYFETDFKFNNVSKFNELKEKATTKELIQLSKSKNKQVKALALMALVELKYKNLNLLLKKALNDEHKIYIKEGCIVSQESFAYLLYDRVSSQHYYNKLDKEDLNYYNSKTKDFNHIIISNKKNYSLLGYALYNNNADVSNYSKIRKLAFNDQNDVAILALAAYKNKKDIPKFIQLREKAFEAIAVFNDESFWDFLLSYKNVEKSENYFKAIASFQNEKSKNLLYEIINNKENDSIINKVFKSTSKYYSPLYLDLYKEIFQRKGYINTKIAKKLIDYNPIEASNIFSEKLLSKDPIYVYYEDYNANELFEIYPLILSIIKHNNYSKLENICINRIKLMDSFTLQAFLEIAEKEKFIDTSEVILERLKNKNTAFNYFHLSKTIFSFQNNESDSIVLNILKENEKDWNWGNWSDSFTELFKTYKLNL